METKTWNTFLNEVDDKYACNSYDSSLDKVKELVSLQILIEEAEDKGATKDELLDILKYMIVVINAEKDLLDWKKAYEDFKIDSYIEKYMES